MQSEFACTLIDGTGELDRALSPIMLPIPTSDKRSENGKCTILPGAPTVYCDPTTFEGFEDTLKVAAWCREQCAFRPAIADSIEEYFTNGDGKEIKSFSLYSA